MASMSDEVFCEGFHYRPLSESSPALAGQLLTAFVDSFAEAALLARPNRSVIEDNVELEAGSDADGHRSIQIGFLFSGHQSAMLWDGTAAEAEALVRAAAREIAESMSTDLREDDGWRQSFEEGA